MNTPKAALSADVPGGRFSDESDRWPLVRSTSAAAGTSNILQSGIEPGSSRSDLSSIIPSGNEPSIRDLLMSGSPEDSTTPDQDIDNLVWALPRKPTDRRLLILSVVRCSLVWPGWRWARSYNAITCLFQPTASIVEEGLAVVDSVVVDSVAGRAVVGTPAIGLRGPQAERVQRKRIQQ
jgi:hypothetical protein